MVLWHQSTNQSTDRSAPMQAKCGASTAGGSVAGFGVQRRLCRSVRISGAPLAVSAGNAPVSAQPPLTAGRSLIDSGWFGTDLRSLATEWHAVDGSDDVKCAPNSAAVTDTAAAVNRRWQPPMHRINAPINDQPPSSSDSIASINQSITCCCCWWWVKCNTSQQLVCGRREKQLRN